MPKPAETMKTSDVRQLLKLTNELAELHDAPFIVQSGQFLERVCQIFNGSAAFLALANDVIFPDCGYTEVIPFSPHEGYASFIRDVYIGNEHFRKSPLEKEGFPTTNDVALLLESIEKSRWTNDPLYELLKHKAELHDMLRCTWRCRSDDCDALVLVVFRSVNDHWFTNRDKQVAEVLHDSLERFYIRIAHELSQADPYQNKVPIGAISRREIQTLRLLLQGLCDKEIASLMQLSAPTVRQYIRSIFRVFQVESRAELLARWLNRSQRAPGQLALLY